MRTLFWSISLLLISGGVFAQDVIRDDVIKVPLQEDMEKHRNRIQAERAREDEKYRVQEHACYLRFSVTDCLREVRAHRREAFDELRRQETLIADTERKRKAMEQMERIKEKAAIQRIENESVQRRKSIESQQEQDERAVKKTEDAVNTKNKLVNTQTQEKKLGHHRSANEIAKELQQYEEKRKQVQEHRANRLKNAQNQPGKLIKPLPEAP